MSAVRQQMEEGSFKFNYHFEDNTLMFSGPVQGVLASVFTYFPTGDSLVRINILLDEYSEMVNVRRFREVRAEYIKRYADYERIASPPEEQGIDLDSMAINALSTFSRSEQGDVWSAWRHVGASGDTTMVEIRLVKLAERPDSPPTLDRLVTRIWYYSPAWFRRQP